LGTPYYGLPYRDIGTVYIAVGICGGAIIKLGGVISDRKTFIRIAIGGIDLP
jgi:fucose permease